jgi:hypothetical protein
VPDLNEPLQAAKAKLQPVVRRGQIAVFVFGPALPTSGAGAKPARRGHSFSHIAKHAQYLRFQTRERLRELGFAADFGEASDILDFWKDFLRSPNDAATEILQARHVCGAIVIFPASFGSMAELALFVHKGDIAQKTLAIVHETHSTASSFFRRGLLELFTIFSGRSIPKCVRS